MRSFITATILSAALVAPAFAESPEAIVQKMTEAQQKLDLDKISHASPEVIAEDTKAVNGYIGQLKAMSN